MCEMRVKLYSSKCGFDDLHIPSKSYLCRQQSFEGEEIRTALRSLSFNGRDIESSIKKSLDSKREALLRSSGSLKGNKISVRVPSPRNNNKNNIRRIRSINNSSYMKVNIDHRSTKPLSASSSPTSRTPKSSKTYNRKKVTLPKSPSSPLSSTSFSLPLDKSPTRKTTICPKSSPTCTLSLTLPSPENADYYYRNLAALEVQKRYKSFRTRRQLADCAVLANSAIGPKWWNLFDSMDLCKVNSLSVPGTNISRWKKAIARAAKVGKGLSRAERARKLALQHWLEAIDPRHRYGHNLQFYYIKWLNCPSQQPFFYWLDIGEGREVSLEKCNRFKLQQQCIQYLGPVERMEYEVAIKSGVFHYKQSRQVLDTTGGSEEVKWIFVLSASKVLYVGKKRRGTFQHSSFLAGGATLSAGRLVVENGTLKAVWPHSGHYLPTEENFQEFMSFLSHHKVDLTYVQKWSTEVEDSRRSKLGGDNNGKVGDERGSDTSEKQCRDRRRSKSRRMRELQSKMASIEIPKREDTLELFKREEEQQGQAGETNENASTEEEYSSSDSDEFSICMQNLFREGKEGCKEENLKKINSPRGNLSYGLAEQLTSRWTTGAGARIGFMKNCPSKALRFRILEEANLSPRTETKISKHPNSAVTNLSSLHLKRENAHRSPLAL